MELQEESGLLELDLSPLELEAANGGSDNYFLRVDPLTMNDPWARSSQLASRTSILDRVKSMQAQGRDDQWEGRQGGTGRSTFMDRIGRIGVPLQPAPPTPLCPASSTLPATVVRSGDGLEIKVTIPGAHGVLQGSGPDNLSEKTFCQCCSGCPPGLGTSGWSNSTEAETHELVGEGDEVDDEYEVVSDGDPDIELAPVEVEDCIPEQEGMRRLKHDLTLDSGAAASVMDCSEVPEYELTPSDGSRRGVRYVGPGGEKMENRGQKTMRFMFESGAVGKSTMQDAAIRKPLVAVSDSCDKGNFVFFSNQESCLAPVNSKEGQAILRIIKGIKNKVRVYRENGVYKIPAWIVPPRSSGFARPGAAA